MSFSVVGPRSARRRVEFRNHPSSVWLRECSLLQLHQSPQNACECNRNVVSGRLAARQTQAICPAHFLAIFQECFMLL